MKNGKIQEWAERFVADLDVGGERVPLDRVIASHHSELRDLRASGLTWRSIAAILARSGARRANGRPISADQLRADRSRIAKRLEDGAALAPPSNAAVAERPAIIPTTTPSVQPMPAKSSPRSQRASVPSTAPLRPPKDVTADDIAAALAQLKPRV